MDIEALIGSIEKVAKTDTEIAGRRTTQLIGFIVGLRNTLPHHTRFSIVNAVFNDAAKNAVPHQWKKRRV
jgi:hypothetical protein